MKLTLISLLVIICFSSATLAQEVDANTKKLLEAAAKNADARELKSEITVSDSTSVQAVLIPRVDAERIFGKEIARNYAVIELNIGNKSKSAALIIHGVFIDYRDWPLSGVPAIQSTPQGRTNKYQAPSVPSQVASEEYRVVRGQLLDAQMDTVRNRFLRWLTLAGNLAGAFTFSLNEQGIIKGIAAATGVGIPGVATAWPDRTVEQLNRVSDLGFRTNKLVPKESAEVIVCFFPIDRFLTPGFRNLFLKSPAVFFAPLAMLADKAMDSEAEAAMRDFIRPSGLTVKDLKEGVGCFMKIMQSDQRQFGYDVCLAEMGLEKYKDPVTHEVGARAIGRRDANGNVELGTVNKGFKVFLALEFLAGVSLNRVTITVDGVMSVDINIVPPRVDEIAINKVTECGDAGDECLWTLTSVASGVRTGVIRGAFLKSADLKIAEADALSITDVKKIDDGSTDDEYRFSFKLNAAIASGTKLHFTMTKPVATPGAKPLESNTWEYVVDYPTTAAKLISVAVDDASTPTTVTVKGARLTPTPLTVSLVPQAGDTITVQAAALTKVTTDGFDITLPTGANKLHPGCWQVQVKAGALSSNLSGMFAIPPSPTLTSAERSDKFIFVKGNDLIDFGSCGGQLVSFKLLKKDDTDPTDLKVKDWNNGSPLLELPDKAKDGEWKVQVFLKGVTEKKGDKPLTVRP